MWVITAAVEAAFWAADTTGLRGTLLRRFTVFFALVFVGVFFAVVFFVVDVFVGAFFVCPSSGPSTGGAASRQPITVDVITRRTTLLLSHFSERTA
jgi:hypothetical protein